MLTNQFIDAVLKKHLVRWHDNGFLRTLEPHLFAQVRGQRDVLIAFQVAGGPAGEAEQCWKMIEVAEGIDIAKTEHFAATREIPGHLQELVQTTYASAVPPSAVWLSAVPRR